MKKLQLSFAAILLLVSTTFAKIFTVSNNAGSPGQYTNLQTAIDANAVHDGDTLLVSGSLIDYGSITFTKRLTLLGQGYAPLKDFALTSQISSLGINSAAAGSVIMGFTGSFYTATTTNNLAIKRNKLSSTQVYGDNLIFSENIFDNFYVAGNNIIVKNNIFTNTTFQNQGAITNLLITNNVFTTQVNFGISNAIVSNNIFYNKLNTNVNFKYLTNSNNLTVNNNITYKNTDTNPFDIGARNITGSGNILNVDPKFILSDITTSTIVSTDNLQLQVTSPAKLAGTDGKDIGVHGGAVGMQYPYSGEPAIPQVKTMNINNTTIAPGTPLQVLLKANSNN